MTVKEFFNEVRTQGANFKALEEEWLEFRSKVYTIQAAQLKDKVQGNHLTDLSETVEQLDAYQRRIKIELDKLVTNRDKANHLINSLEDDDMKAVLRRRHLMNDSWDDIASTLHRSKRDAQRKQGKAFLLLTPIFQKMENS